MSTSGPIDINAVIGGFVDRGIWTYYDTADVAAGASTGTQISFFANPISPSRSRLLTNMTQAGQFPAPRCLILDNLGFYFSTDTIKADVDFFLKNCFLEFKIDEKVYFEGHMWRYASGYGLYGVTTRTNESAWQIGKPDLNANLHFGDKYAKYIAPQQPFSLNLYFPTAQTMTTAANGGAGVRLIAVLQGLTDRAVQ